MAKLVQYRINRANESCRKVFSYDENSPLTIAESAKRDYVGDIPVGAAVMLRVEKGPRLYPLFKDFGLEVRELAGNHVYWLQNSVTKEPYPYKVRRDRLKLKSPIRTGQEIIEA